MYKNHIKPICDSLSLSDNFGSTVTEALVFNCKAKLKQAAYNNAAAAMKNERTTDLADEVFQYRTMLILLGEREAEIDALVGSQTKAAMSDSKKEGGADV